MGSIPDTPYSGKEHAHGMPGTRLYTAVRRTSLRDRDSARQLLVARAMDLTDCLLCPTHTHTHTRTRTRTVVSAVAEWDKDTGGACNDVLTIPIQVGHLIT